MGITSKKETILDRIIGTTLPLINGAGDYNLELITISRDFRYPWDLNNDEFPAVFVVDDEPTMFTPMSQRGFTTGSSVESVEDAWILQLWGYIKLAEQTSSTTTGVLEQEMNKLMSDLMIAMAVDRKFNGTAQDSAVISNHNSLEYAEDAGFGIVLQRYGIKVDFNPADSVT